MTSRLRVIKVDDRTGRSSVKVLRMYGSRWAAQPRDGACRSCVKGTSWFSHVNYQDGGHHLTWIRSAARDRFSWLVADVMAVVEGMASSEDVLIRAWGFE